MRRTSVCYSIVPSGPRRPSSKQMLRPKLLERNRGWRGFFEILMRRLGFFKTPVENSALTRLELLEEKPWWHISLGVGWYYFVPGPLVLAIFVFCLTHSDVIKEKSYYVFWHGARGANILMAEGYPDVFPAEYLTDHRTAGPSFDTMPWEYKKHEVEGSFYEGSRSPEWSDVFGDLPTFFGLEIFHYWYLYGLLAVYLYTVFRGLYGWLVRRSEFFDRQVCRIFRLKRARHSAAPRGDDWLFSLRLKFVSAFYLFVALSASWWLVVEHMDLDVLSSFLSVLGVKSGFLHYRCYGLDYALPIGVDLESYENLRAWLVKDITERGGSVMKCMCAITWADYAVSPFGPNGTSNFIYDYIRSEQPALWMFLRAAKYRSLRFPPFRPIEWKLGYVRGGVLLVVSYVLSQVFR
jgi:hypothetical protein